MTTLTLTSAPPSARLVWESSDLPAGTHTLTVTRTADGVTETVLGGSSLFADGGAVLDDGNIPIGVLVVYAADAYAEDGTLLGAVDQITGTIAASGNTAWVSDPRDPRSVVQVTLEQDFGSSLSQTRDVQIYQVGTRVVALMGALGKLIGLSLRMITQTLIDADQLKAILLETSVLIRTPPPIRLPRLLYVVVPTVTEADNNLASGGELVLWDIQGSEISPNTLDILIPLVTYQTYMDAFPGATYADVMAVYTGTYLDAIKNPPGA